MLCQLSYGEQEAMSQAEVSRNMNALVLVLCFACGLCWPTLLLDFACARNSAMYPATHSTCHCQDGRFLMPCRLGPGGVSAARLRRQARAGCPTVTTAPAGGTVLPGRRFWHPVMIIASLSLSATVTQGRTGQPYRHATPRPPGPAEG